MSHSPHVPEHKVAELGKNVWEDLEKIVEERLKAEKPIEQPVAGEGQSGKGSAGVTVPNDVYA